MKTTLALAPIVMAWFLAQGANPLRGPGSAPVEPYQVIGNIYYVGAANVSAHIIGTQQGLILLDTGTEQMLAGVSRNIEKLGHRLQDVKIILSSHAHWDHVENHAEMKKLTGARVMALGQDASAIASGIDSSSLGGQGWKPTGVDRTLQDGDSVTLGSVTMKAHLTPGHTKGCTTWSTSAEVDGRAYSVVFVGGTSINGGVTLLDNQRHPGIIEDYARTFRVLKELQPDVFLAQHPAMYRMADKMRRLKEGAARNPFIDPEGYDRFVKAEESKYLRQLQQEQSSKR